MPTPQQKIDAVHESGHALLGKLFDDDFEVKSITLKPELFKNQVDTSGWRGGIQLTPRKNTIRYPTIENKDELIIAMWGGLAAQNIYLKGQDDIRQNIETYMNQSELLDRYGFSGDWDLTQKYIDEQTKARNVSYKEYRFGFLGFAFNYLIINEVWKTVESLSEAVLQKSNLTLVQKEIEAHYNKSGFNKYLYRNKAKILKPRFQVTFERKVIYFVKSIF